MDEKRKKEILSDIKYNNALGSHTFSMCKCGRQGCRANKCNLCLKEELYGI